MVIVAIASSVFWWIGYATAGQLKAQPLEQAGWGRCSPAAGKNCADVEHVRVVVPAVGPRLFAVPAVGPRLFAAPAASAVTAARIVTGAVATTRSATLAARPI